MDITEVSILHHIGLVLALLWILSSFNICNPLAYFASLVYLYQVNECYMLKLQRRLHFEERKQANQKRLLSDSETVRWLNHAIERIWPICMEQIMSQKVLLPIIPWFLDKYRPWTVGEEGRRAAVVGEYTFFMGMFESTFRSSLNVKVQIMHCKYFLLVSLLEQTKAVVHNLYLGRDPPMFTEVKVLHQSADDDHLVLELGMNFLAADDMRALLAVKLRKRLGFGIWAKLHVTGMHIEGRVLVGVKFLRHWPFLGRLRLCFIESPYLQMTVKPIFSHGLDVTELPGIAGWLDKILAVAFEQTLVEPNMLVVDVEKFASKPTESWFTMDEKCPIAFAKVEVVEAADLKPSDLNGLADPYAKGQLGSYRFQTKTQKKTLAPKWHEEFKIPIHTWETPSVLFLEVCDEDHFIDDTLGNCSINISNLRGGQRHDKWLSLQNIKMGRLHLAVTVVEDDGKGEHLSEKKKPNEKENTNAKASDAVQQDSAQWDTKMSDKFEPIDIEGQQQTGIWVHYPGSDISQTWEPRKRESRHPEIGIGKEANVTMNSPRYSYCSDVFENPEGTRLHQLDTIRKSLQKVGSVFQRNSRSVSLKAYNNEGEAVPSPHINIHAISEKGIGVNFVLDDENSGAFRDRNPDEESANQGHMRSKTKNILKQAGRSAYSIKHALSRKDSNKNRIVEPSLVNEREILLGSDSSDKEPISSLKG